jgi:hypothetical protein
MDQLPRDSYKNPARLFFFPIWNLLDFFSFSFFDFPFVVVSKYGSAVGSEDRNISRWGVGVIDPAAGTPGGGGRKYAASDVGGVYCGEELL